MLTQIKHSNSHVLIAGLALLLVAPRSVVPANSSELGHCAPALFRPRDFFVPPAGSYASLIWLTRSGSSFSDTATSTTPRNLPSHRTRLPNMI